MPGDTLHGSRCKDVEIMRERRRKKSTALKVSLMHRKRGETLESREEAPEYEEQVKMNKAWGTVLSWLMEVVKSRHSFSSMKSAGCDYK